jgi:hypothetical protein
MPSTRIQNDIGAQDNGCAAVSLLSKSAQEAIMRLQEQLAGQLEGTIWTMPATSLHTTLCEIIQPKPYSQDKQLLYETNHVAYEAVLAEVLSRYKPIDVAFNTIEVSPQAIIVLSDDNGVFNKIRAELVERLPFPEETKKPPDVVHSSIARFTKEVDIEKVKAVAEQFDINFTEIIREFQFMYPIWPHLLHYDVVRRYPLEDK